jgi:hypothetical protein
MRKALSVLAVGLLSGFTPRLTPGEDPGLRLSWEKNMLTIPAPRLPGGKVEVWYLEAYCRSGSTDRKWGETVIPHRTKKVSEEPGGKSIELECEVEGEVRVRHVIRAGDNEIDFQVEAENRGAAYVDAVWVQPCMRVKEFTGGTQENYISRCFIFKDRKQTFLDKTPRAEKAIYLGGQVYVPAGIDRKDVNPRPLSPDVPSNGLIGCVSADGRLLLATAWEPYQELFQGVIVCIHSDFRLGGLKPGETKRARGKIYLLNNDLEKLLDRYRKDFPGKEG